MAGDQAPAFLFYAKDFLAGTVTMSLQARGAYITLLAYEWDHGCVPAAPSAVGRILGLTTAQAGKLWPELADKFALDSDGQWRNARLEAERSKQAERRAAQAHNGRLGGRPKKPPGDPPHEPNPNPNESHGFTEVNLRANPNESQRKANIKPNKSFSFSFPVSVRQPSADSLSRDGEDPLLRRAGRLLERYQELFSLHRHGAKYHNRMHLDFPKACDLVRTWDDDARLEKLAVIVLTTDDDWIAKSDRGFGVFATRATWADDRLRQWEREHET
jgi:uncharacterized protein YdaU (DUF1376 family)